MSFEEFVPGRSWRGLKQFKLDAGSSYGIQQRLGYWTYRQYGVPASRQSSCRFILNLGGSDDYRGCYGIEEVVKKAFIRYRWPNLASVTGNLYKLDNQTSTWSVDSYRWRGTDPAQYVPIPFSPKTNEVGGDYADLVTLCDVLNNVPLASRRTELEKIMNVDGQLAVLAVCTTVADSDGLFNNMRELNNHYWYHREDTNKLEVLPWDADGSYVYQPYDTSAWKWFYETRPAQGGDTPSVLNAWIPNDRVARESFAAKVRQVVAGPLSTARSRADFINNQIRSHVTADPYKPISNAQFDADVQAVKDWIPQRISFLQGEMALPTVTITAVDGAASEPGSDTASFRVSRAGATSAPLTVDLAIAGTATNGSDYNSLGTSVTISRGQGSVTVTVTPRDDTSYEGSETVTLTIAGHPSYVIGASSGATLTIADNESPAAGPTVTVSATDAGASEPGTNRGTFTVSRTGSTSASLAVTFTVGGTATPGSDYASIGTSVTIPAAESSATVAVTPSDDTEIEPAETVILTLAPGASYTVASPSSATVTIQDDDGAGTVTASFQDGTAGYSGTRDTYIVQSSPDSNFGAAPEDRVDGELTTGSGDDVFALLKWDLSSIPPGSAVGSATITLNITNPSADPYEVYELKRGWTEAQATWNVAATGAAWQSAGAQGSMDRGTASLGTLTPAAPGTYVLTFNSAGRTLVRSWIDSPASNFGILIAGPANLDGAAFDSREGTTAAGRPKLTVIYTPGTPPPTGLAATYYDNMDFTGATVTRTDPRIDFDWTTGSPAAGIGADTFSVRWSGRVQPVAGETYTFHTVTDDGVRLWVNGELLVDRWVDQGPIEWSGAVALEAGAKVTILMEYYENGGGASAQLFWSSPSTPRQVIPQSRLDPESGPPDSRDNDGDGIPNDQDPDDDNDGIPDLQDPDRDGDGAANVVETAAGTDPDDRSSVPGGGGGGGGGGCGATGLEALAWLGLLAGLKRVRGIFLLWGVAAITLSCGTAQADPREAGPLRVHAANSRYFSDGSGKPVYLTGTHTWANLQDVGPSDPPPAFDFAAYLDLLRANNLNFIRLWRMELTRFHDDKEELWGRGWKTVAPHPWLRTGPGTARDGKPKFDLKRFDPAYFERLRARVKAAGERGVYVGIMLFEGWHLLGNPAAWVHHPFHPDSNVNGVNGDPNGDGKGSEAYSLEVPAVLECQKAYVNQVIDTVNDLDNVVYEIANENAVGVSKDWQYHLIEHIQRYEKGKPGRHPVGMTSLAWSFASAAGNDLLYASPAQWISLAQTTRFDSAKDPYASNPPAADGRKVSLLDSDHIGWKIYIDDAAFTRAWVWKSFLRGHNPILMENLRDREGWIAGRKAMGHTRAYAERMDLGGATPQDALASTGYCLARAGKEYLAYQPASGAFTLALAEGAYAVEWFDPQQGTSAAGGTVSGPGAVSFAPPFPGPAVLHLKSVAPPQRER